MNDAVTGFNIRKWVIEYGIKEYHSSDCSLCKAPLFYRFYNDQVYFDPKCRCTVKGYKWPIAVREYQDVANLFNQQIKEVKDKMIEAFKSSGTNQQDPAVPRRTDRQIAEQQADTVARALRTPTTAVLSDVTLRADGIAVTVIDYCGAGTRNPARYAANKMIFAKSTRLQMSPTLRNKIADMSDEVVYEELKYIANTLPSSWEFLTYDVLVEGVSRAFTHQMVRTRTASYAQQAMRVVDVTEGKGWGYHIPDVCHKDSDMMARYSEAMDSIDKDYRDLINAGMPREDARELLPNGIKTNILIHMNLRTVHDLVRKRSSHRVQGEYRTFLELAKQAVMTVHPFLSLFLERDDLALANELRSMVTENCDPEVARNMHKLIDKIITEK